MAHLKPGDDILKAIKKTGEGEVIVLQPGRYRGFSLYDWVKPVRILGNGATVTGKGLKFENCPTVSLTGLSVLETDSFGVMVVNATEVSLVGLNCSKNRKNGILTANSSGVLVSNCTCDDNGEQHGIYLSQSGDNLKIAGNVCRRNGRAGIQVNAVQPGGSAKDKRRDSISEGVVISGNVLEGNQKLGGAGINLAGCRKVTLEANHIINHLGRHGIALWDDGTNNRQLACHDVIIQRNSFCFAKTAKPAACISISDNCSGVVVSANICAEGVKFISGPYTELSR